ncbi:MAG: DEAD/DEAH box helicase, partial [Pseudomonadota bacterium]
MDQGKEFSEYKLDNHLSQALNSLGFERSTPIQDQAIPLVVSGQDVAGLAQTGTGKTAAFLLPLIERVLRSQAPSGDEDIDKRAFEDWKDNHFNLVLVPTRELAEQVKDCALDFLKGTDHRVVVVYGG